MFYSKRELNLFFQEMGIKKGDILCLQINEKIELDIQLILEVLMELVSKEGLIFMPSFTFRTKDPASMESIDLKDWSNFRQEMLGYRKEVTFEDNVSRQFMLNKNVKRTTHPVYSFLYWGNSELISQKEEMDFPLSFENGLRPLTHKNAKNVCIGVAKENALILDGLAHQNHLGVVEVQKAKIKRMKSSIFRTYMIRSVSSKEKETLISQCHCEIKSLDHMSVSILQLEQRN